jgi:hypothetical protein
MSADENVVDAYLEPLYVYLRRHKVFLWRPRICRLSTLIFLLNLAE